MEVNNFKMKNIILLICVITALSIQAQKINWNNVGPFPIEEKGGIIFYNIDGEKCSDILYDKDQDDRYIIRDYNLYPVKKTDCGDVSIMKVNK